MNLSDKEISSFLSVCNELLYSDPFTNTKNYIQHGSVSTDRKSVV